MKLRSLLASLSLVVAAIVGASLYAQTPPAAGPGGPGGPGGGARGPQAPKTELEKNMDVINDSKKALDTLPITDAAKKDQALETLTAMRAAFVNASKETPKYLAAQPEDKKKTFMDDFASQMKKVLAAMDATIASVKAGKADDITKNWKDVDDIHNDSHKEFRAPRGARGPGGPGGPGGGAPGGGAPRGN